MYGRYANDVKIDALMRTFDATPRDGLRLGGALLDRTEHTGSDRARVAR